MGGLRPRRILILGGTGFVGTELRKQAEAQGGWECITLSRRGGIGPSHVAGDATSPGVIEAVVAERGPFSAYVHCLGALLDGKSGLRFGNLLVSASRSLPAPGQSYDDITTATALELLRVARAARHAADGTEEAGSLPPFVFVSAAEAGWADASAGMRGGATLESWLAPRWLRRYLRAKRAVEAAALEAGHGAEVRPVILRPSFVWRWSKLDVLLPVTVFTLLNFLGVPFIDRPVRVEVIAAAMLRALEAGSAATGVLRHGEMEALAAAQS